MTKRHQERIRVHNKFGGRCAYCGKVITVKEMQVDHQYPKAQASYHAKRMDAIVPDIHHYDNLYPACRRCNHYKRDNTLEQFRSLMLTLHERIGKLYTNKVAIDYGIITLKPFDGIFYFEKFNELNK